ncbi:MAG TPA: 50S ribosomal protein L34 [Candidatus Paceibacterota bacterium]
MSTTYKPKKRKRARTHGFLSRQKTSTGRRTIRNRRRKGRTRLSTV